MRYLVPVAASFCLQQLLAGREDGMRQSDVARLSGISLNTINSIFHNKTTRVDLATLEAIAGALGVRPGDLITSDRPQPGSERTPTKRGRTKAA